MPDHVELTDLSGTVAFAVRSVDPAYARVYGGVFDQENKRWLFPAYPPFGGLVCADLIKVKPAITYDDKAKEQASYLNDLPAKLTARSLPENFTFVTKPFDHQIEGLSYLYHHPRFALFWDMGTGKSKVIVDLKRCFPRQRMLIFGPKVTVRNWAREFKTHATEGVRVGVLSGTPEQKRRVIANYRDYDVIVASYGTARNMGLPRLHNSTVTLIKNAMAAGRALSTSGMATLTRAIQRLGDPDRQEAYVLAWAMGSTLADVERAAVEEATNNPRWLIDVDYQIIVADESHCIKQTTAQQTKAVLALAKKAPRRYLMSGTPTLGDPRHLYPQLRFLSPAIVPEDWFAFMNKFLVRSPYNKHIVTGFQNMDILNKRVQRVSIQKKKEECLDLPERTVIDVPVELSPEQRKLYDALRQDMALVLESGDALEVQNAAVLLNKLAQVGSGFLITPNGDDSVCNGCPSLTKCVDSGIRPYTADCAVNPDPPPSKIQYTKENPKLEALSELLEGLLEAPTNKVIVWALYRAELDQICELLEKADIGYVRVDGSTGGNLQKKIDDFNGNPKKRVYVSQISTGIGVTLNSAAYTIYYALDWSLGTYLQSIDRNYRAGQDKKVTVYRLIGEGTVDEYKAKLLSAKLDISTALTAKLPCTTCERRFSCLESKIEPFDPGCIYKSSAKKITAKAGNRETDSRKSRNRSNRR